MYMQRLFQCTEEVWIDYMAMILDCTGAAVPPAFISLWGVDVNDRVFIQRGPEQKVDHILFNAMARDKCVLSNCMRAVLLPQCYPGILKKIGLEGNGKYSFFSDSAISGLKDFKVERIVHCSCQLTVNATLTQSTHWKSSVACDEHLDETAL